MNKKLFKATFNYAGVNYRLFTTSTSQEKAFLNFINQLSKRLNVGKRTLMFAFNGSKDNYFIKEVKDDDDKRATHTSGSSGEGKKPYYV